MFRKLRIVVLLYLLLIVVLTNWSAHERNTDWGEPLSVVIYPINGDRSDKISSYIASLSTTQFLPIEEAMRVQAQHWGVAIQNPFDIKIAPEVNSLPPTPPLNGNPFSIGYWLLVIGVFACATGRGATTVLAARMTSAYLSCTATLANTPFSRIRSDCNKVFLVS